MHSKRMRVLTIVGLASVCSLCLAQSNAPLYTNNFSQAPLGAVPDEMLVLDGAFAVKEEQGNRVLALPGAPLDSYGVLFGPTSKDGVAVTARVYGTGKGRRFPTFAVGLNGVAGYRLQVSPAKKLVELFRGDLIKTNAPFQWPPGTWTRLQLQVRKSNAGWRIEGKAWTDGSAEPVAPLIVWEEMVEAPPGRASLFASPFAGTPVLFDDLALTKLPPD